MRRIAQAAGETIMAYYDAGVTVRAKADSSPVTDADEAAERLIVDALRALTPDVPVVAEEMFAEDGAPEVAGGPFWLVDPLDGTKEFVRHNGNFTWSQRGGARYQRGYVYAQTDLPDWHAQLLAGESSTSGMLFDAVSFRGVQIASDDRMLPDEQRYYAPVVRGVAQSNAKVAIYQRGYLVHETTVAPGPFAIDNLQAMSYGGDLNVTVTEASGETRSFVVPFATTVQLLRPGSTRFSAMAGRAIDLGGNVGTQYVGQFTVQRGVSNAVTAYGGAAFASRYQSVLMGVGLNTSIGGFAADITIARTQPSGSERLTGSSVRVSYSKNLPNSGTNFSLLAYRYSTKGYLGLRDALLLNGQSNQGTDAASFARLRNRVDLNVFHCHPHSPSRPWPQRAAP
ncbi:MAG: fimbria/pilus outer membrane usher protein, partial [Proteobacteria bacterium]|nr:fimbria/pilus outer membrane usher protein [Pseudomonadota bacterium]